MHSSQKQIHQRLKNVLGASSHWTELRYHRKASHVLGVLKGEVSEMSSKHYEGVGLRCLVDGTWGFASTSDLSEEALKSALANAESMARERANRKKHKIKIASTDKLAHGTFFLDGYEELQKISWEEKFK